MGIRGDKEHLARLKSITGPAMVKKVGAALLSGGGLIQIEAQHSITEGSVSGKGHVPSLPGEPPNRDSGVLDNNIETALVEPLHVEVSSNAPYARDMEFGNSKVAARPYMRPAVAKKRAEVIAKVKGAVSSIVNGKGA